MAKIPKNLFKLPPPSDKKKKKKRPKCDDCKVPLLVRKVGWGHCEECHRGVPLPIGHIASDGPHAEKEVFLASAIFKEFLQDMDYDEAEDEFDKELRTSRNFFIIWDMEYE